jgi:hypothetical protein
MTERGIIFSAEMVWALLAGRKRVTRRLSKRWLKVQFGDRLWVRESLHRPDGDPWLYRADNLPVMVDPADQTPMIVWAHHKDSDFCSSMFMPRWASRITLEATDDAWTERLQNITEEEAQGEGVLLESKYGPWITGGKYETYHAAFFDLWETLHAKPGEGWSDNPEVVRVAFRVLEVRS